MTTKQSFIIDEMDEPRLTKFAEDLAGLARPPMVIFLSGPLGAGKTTFARAMIRALGYAGRVKSPTYSLVETYSVESAEVVHLDLYRINDPGELEYLGLDSMPEAAICLVEWPERGLAALPLADLDINIDGSGSVRKLVLVPKSEKAVTLMESVAWSAYSN